MSYCNKGLPAIIAKAPSRIILEVFPINPVEIEIDTQGGYDCSYNEYFQNVTSIAIVKSRSYKGVDL